MGFTKEINIAKEKEEGKQERLRTFLFWLEPIQEVLLLVDFPRRQGKDRRVVASDSLFFHFRARLYRAKDRRSSSLTSVMTGVKWRAGRGVKFSSDKCARCIIMPAS